MIAPVLGTMSGHDHDHEAGHHHEYVDAGVEQEPRTLERVNRRPPF